MNIEAMRLWSKHDQGHASTYLSLEDARLVVEVYDVLCAVFGDGGYVASDPIGRIISRMEGV